MRHHEAIALAGEAKVSTTDDICKSVLAMMNNGRTVKSIASLKWNNDLEAAARVRASEASQRWSHTRPDGSDWWTVNSKVQYGENLGKGYTTAEEVYAAWMASPTHAANIMDERFKTVAVAVYQDSDGIWYWAEEFGY